MSRPGSWIGAVVALLVAAGGATAEWSGGAGGRLGLGYDSNVYLAPGSGYFDPFSNGRVDPTRQGGWFVPYRGVVDGEVSGGRLAWLSGARASGRVHLDPDLRNADTYRLTADTGLELTLARRGVRRDRLYLGPSVAHVKRTYFDRDTGADKATTTTGESLADRYVYTRYGGEARLRMRTRPVKFQLHGSLAHYNYEEVPLLSSLDHDYFTAGAEVEGRPLKRTRLSIGYDYTVRDYDERLARDRNGDQVAGNDVLRYGYHALTLGVVQRLGDAARLYLEYDWLRREDGFVGYNDYTRHRFGVRGKVRAPAGWGLDGGVRYWRRNYPRAFAFDDPAFDKRVYRTWDLSLGQRLPLNAGWRLWAGQELRLQDCTDPRYDYHRYQLLAGVAAEF